MRKTNYNEIEKLTFRLNYIEDENTKLKELLEQNGNDLKDKNIKKKKKILFKIIKKTKMMIKLGKIFFFDIVFYLIYFFS